MRSLRWFTSLVLVALLAGCPEPPPPTPPPPGGGQQPPAGGEQGGAQPGGEGGEQGGAQPGGEQAGGGVEVAEWKVIAPEVREQIYPMLQPLTTWPEPSRLRPVSDAPEAQRPSAERARLLKELVGYIVAEDLRPTDPDAALGLDAKGRLYMQLGRGKPRGSASLEVHPEGIDPGQFPLFALVIDDPQDGPHTLEQLRKRVSRIVTPALAKELRREQHMLEAHPQLSAQAGAATTAAMAILDRQGYGTQFPYLYAYATDRHVVVLLQEVPHRSLDEGK